jgi:hypothetical protein
MVKAQRFAGENIENSLATDFLDSNNTGQQTQHHSTSASSFHLLFRIRRFF